MQKNNAKMQENIAKIMFQINAKMQKNNAKMQENIAKIMFQNNAKMQEYIAMTS